MQELGFTCAGKTKGRCETCSPNTECVSAEKKANHLPCPLGVKEEGIRLTGLRDKEERKQGSAGAYGSGFSR